MLNRIASNSDVRPARAGADANIEPSNCIKRSFMCALVADVAAAESSRVHTHTRMQ